MRRRLVDKISLSIPADLGGTDAPGEEERTSPGRRRASCGCGRLSVKTRCLLAAAAIVFIGRCFYSPHRRKNRPPRRNSSRVVSAPGIVEHGSSESRGRGVDWFGLPPSKFAIVQFDGRKPWQRWGIGPTTVKYINTRHNVGAVWNYLYTRQHGHEYMYYHWGEGTTKGCYSNNNQTLAEAWCKIKAMLAVQEDFPDADYFLYLDTDAVVDPMFYGEPLANLLHNMTTDWLPNWNIHEKPFTLNMEGVSYWCNRVQKEGNFSHCINCGTVLWMRSAHSTRILEQWWRSADDPYDKEDNILGYKFREKTPWEQVKAQYMLKEPISNRIQIVPQPQYKIQTRGPCLSDCWLPPTFDQLGCFILHYCMKEGMVDTYGRRIQAYLKENQIAVNDDICYPRALLSPNAESSGDNSMQRKVDRAPCHPQWIGESERLVEI